jgi:magnesium transporter
MINDMRSLPERVTFETAATHASTQVPITSSTARAGDIRQALVGQRYESATHIVVCDAGQFCGILRLEGVLARISHKVA